MILNTQLKEILNPNISVDIEFEVSKQAIERDK